MTVVCHPLLLYAGEGGQALGNSEPETPENVACLECHSQSNRMKKTQLTFKDGTQRSLIFDSKAWEESIHGSSLQCTDCHQKIDKKSHPLEKNKINFESDRDYILMHSESCQRCHYTYYTRVIDSIHFEMRNAGKKNAPTCGDCHSAHSMKNPRIPRAEISKKCGRCHQKIYGVYQNSIHGKALESEGNQDVPVCTDCHSAHSISDPRTSQFHAAAYQLCAKCHSDEEKMKRNGLNTAAYTTYLDDFHGKSNRIYSQGSQLPQKIIASCTDCHGSHDIQSNRVVGQTQSKTQIREKIIGNCRKCHESVPVGFADAWLSHYPPEMDKAPLLWGLKWFYRIFDPFLIGLFILNVLLNLWRMSVRGNLGQTIGTPGSTGM